MTNVSSVRHKLLLAGAAAGLGMIVFSAPANAADAAATPQAQAQAAAKPLALPPGFETKNVDADSGVKSGLTKVTDHAVGRNDFNAFIAELAKQDKERVREFKGVDQPKLNALVEQIQKQWKSKYGQDFGVTDKNVVFDQQFVIAQGQVRDPAVALNNWPAPAVAGEAVTAGSHTELGNEKDQEKAAKLTAGRDVALVRFPASHGLPEITVSMIRQLPVFWRVDVPNDRSGEQIYTDLVAHLTYLRDHADAWPSNINDGYRMVAHHAIAALYGVPVPGANG